MNDECRSENWNLNSKLKYLSITGTGTGSCQREIEENDFDHSQR